MNNVDKFSAALKQNRQASQDGRTSIDQAPKATFLPPILCVECPSCHSRVHPRVRTFERADGYDVVRGMCPFCGGVYWVYNREQERPSPEFTPKQKRTSYVYRP
jgi:hypothetical protein